MMGVTDTRRQGVNQLDLYCSYVVPLSHTRVGPVAAAALCYVQHVMTACHFVVFRHAYTQSSVAVWIC